MYEVLEIEGKLLDQHHERMTFFLGELSDPKDEIYGLSTDKDEDRESQFWTENFDWNAEIWFSTRFRKYQDGQELIADVDYTPVDTDYTAGHTKADFARLRVWVSNGTLNAGSVVILQRGDDTKASCRYCGAIMTYAQCLDHTGRNERDAMELFTALAWAHGYSEMSRNPKVTNFAQGEVSINTKAIWDNYRA